MSWEKKEMCQPEGFALERGEGALSIQEAQRKERT